MREIITTHEDLERALAMRGGARAGAGAPKKEIKQEIKILLKITPEEKIYLDEEAKKQGWSRNKLIRRLIEIGKENL
jgi:hypothetical protein